MRRLMMAGQKQLSSSPTESSLSRDPAPESRLPHRPSTPGPLQVHSRSTPACAKVQKWSLKMDGLEKIDSEQKTEPQVSAKITDSTETKAQQNKRKREDAEPERPGPERTEPERPGPERTEPERTGPERTEPERTGPERPEPERKKTGVSEVIVILDDDDEKESPSTSASTHVFKIPEIPFWRRNTVKRVKTPPAIQRQRHPQPLFPANQMVFYETRQSVFIQSGEANRSRPLHQQRHSQPLASHLLPQQQAANQSCPHIPCAGMQHVRPTGSHQNQVVPNEVLLLVPSGHQGELHPPPLPQLIPLYRAPQTGTFDGERM
uniref:Uncharacterized protein n=1 Tax=Knipowitschia caucasica TaxID=637954 RepID=A0AAV2KR49_KNICA